MFLEPFGLPLARFFEGSIYSSFPSIKSTLGAFLLLFSKLGALNLFNFGRPTPLPQCMKFMGLKAFTPSLFVTVTISDISSTEISFSVDAASEIKFVDD